MCDLDLEARQLIQSLELGLPAHPIQALNPSLEGNAEHRHQVINLRFSFGRKIAHYVDSPNRLSHNVVDGVDRCSPSLRLFRNAAHGSAVEGETGRDEALGEVGRGGIGEVERLPGSERIYRSALIGGRNLRIAVFSTITTRPRPPSSALANS